MGRLANSEGKGCLRIKLLRVKDIYIYIFCCVTFLYTLTYVIVRVFSNNKVFIQASGLACEVCVEVSLLCFLPAIVCGIADSIV